MKINAAPKEKTYSYRYGIGAKVRLTRKAQNRRYREDHPEGSEWKEFDDMNALDFWEREDYNCVWTVTGRFKGTYEISFTDITYRAVRPDELTLARVKQPTKERQQYLSQLLQLKDTLDKLSYDLEHIIKA